MAVGVWGDVLRLDLGDLEAEERDRLLVSMSRRGRTARLTKGCQEMTRAGVRNHSYRIYGMWDEVGEVARQALARYAQATLGPWP